MNSWSSNCNTAHMANNLVKWWKTKFLNGYKPFTVECNEGRASDTEELLGRRSPEYPTSCTTPPLQNQTTPNASPLPLNIDQQTPQHHLNLQEFSCDVSVEGGPDKSSQERQEFSFTLYDFDGHGKITKDDIAGLVTTIYEVLGSSVKVPHYGSKTIKVKLTVSPDQRKHVSATVIGHKDNKSEEKYQDQHVKTKQDLNVTIKEHVANNDKKKHCRNQRKGQDRKHYCCRKLDEEHEVGADVSEDYSDICSRLSAEATSEDEEGECSENRRCKRIHQKRYQKHSTSRYTTPNRCMKESNTVNQKDSFLRSKKVKKRSSSLQRQELLEIIQSNMDKNNPSFQTTRKPCTDHINVENNQLSQNDIKHRHRHKSMQVPRMPLQYLANVVDPTHFYVDLSSLQNTTQFPQNNCQYDKLVDAVMRVSGKKETKSDSCRRHNRSKSYDLSSNTTPLRYQLLEHPIINIENANKSSRKPPRKLTDFEPTAAVKKNIRKFPQVVLGHTSSPHHLRHRNRQEDQARAMAQVVRWLEQEFSSNLKTHEDTKEKVQSNCWAGDQEKYSCNMPATPNSGIERHEHHHVHEHIHHHYHHYQETAPVVV